MPSLTRKTSLAWSANSVINSFRVFGLNHDVNQILNINNPAYVGAFQSDHGRLGGRFTQINFSSELRGAYYGSPADLLAPEMALLRACGFSYSKVTSPSKLTTMALGDPHFTTETPGVLTPITLQKMTDGNLWQADNCVGDVQFNFIANQIATMDFKFKGDYKALPVAASAVSFFVGETPVACQNGSVSIANGSTWSSLTIRSLVCAVNNMIPDRPDLNSDYGFAPFAIVGRDPIYTMVVELPYHIADFSPEAVYEAQDELHISYTHNDGGSAGSEIGVTFDAYIDEQPTPSEDNGMMVYEIKMRQSIDHSPGASPGAGNATPLTLKWS
jgi:hypothetical protein